MRTLTLSEQTAIASYVLPMALLVEMDLAAPLYMNSAGREMTLNGVTYIGTNGLGEVEAIRDSAGEFAALKFRISGVPSSHIAFADSTDTANKPIRVKIALFDPATYRIISTRTRFAGRLEPLVITDGPDISTLEVTAESDATRLMRPIGSLFSDAEQQRLYPGDVFFQFVTSQAEMRVVWPAASWGRQ